MSQQDHTARVTWSLSDSYPLALVGICVVYQITQWIYNLLFHPLRHIPGPRLAAATYFLEFYYDVVLFGRYTNRIKEMHDKYGPIVRISPNEVHCSDISFVDEIYAIGTRKRDKPIHQVRGSGAVEGAVFSTADHETHRIRRNALAKFFSRSQVFKLEPKLHALAERLCDKILVTDQGTPFDVTTAYSLFSTDVISDYCFGKSLGLLQQKGWEPNFRGPLYSLVRQMYYLRFFPWLKYAGIVMAQIMKHVSEDMALLLKTITVDMPKLVVSTKADIEAGTDKGTTVLGSLLQSDLPPSEKSVRRLTDEATAMFSAGTETVSWALTVITYHLLSHPAMLERLTAEIAQVVDDSKKLPPWATLEKLPYLNSVIYEGLRLSYGLASRTSRIATDEDLVYRGEWKPKGSSTTERVEYIIPRGYAIGLSAVITHHDETLFPNSHAFLPERWLDDNGQHKKQLDRALLSFSKGSRACIGMNLAFCELNLLLAALTLRVFPRMRLFETTEEDVRYDHDIFNPLPVSTSKGVRTVIVE